MASHPPAGPRAADIYTTGFTQTSAERFFSTLQRAGVKRLIDVRLNNVSQLAGFAKRGDLEYFLRVIGNIDYGHELRLAPRREELEAYRAGKLTWHAYEAAYETLLRERRVEETVPRSLFDVPAVLLCSEARPEKCHRRLAAEYLARAWGGMRIVHL
jgi:uncharacterized protein (DUF488 family)